MDGIIALSAPISPFFRKKNSPPFVRNFTAICPDGGFAFRESHPAFGIRPAGREGRESHCPRRRRFPPIPQPRRAPGQRTGGSRTTSFRRPELFRVGKLLPHGAAESDIVAVVGDQRGDVKAVMGGVRQHPGGEIDVGPLFLRDFHTQSSAPCRERARRRFHCGDVTVMNQQVPRPRQRRRRKRGHRRAASGWLCDARPRRGIRARRKALK